MIPDEAVEAAARATYEHANFGAPWESAEPDWKAAYSASVMAGLKAAAPHLMARAWEEGRLDGYADAQRGYDTAMNPYEAPDAG